MLINTNFEFILNFNVEWWYCISRQSVQYRQPHCSPVQYATGYKRQFCGKVRKIMVNLTEYRIYLIHTCCPCKSLLLSCPSDNIPTSAAIFCLQRSVQYCTLSLERFEVHSITYCKVSVQWTLRYFTLTSSRFYYFLILNCMIKKG